MTDRTENAADIERRLRESELRRRLLTEASSDVLYRMSPDWGELKELDGGGFLPSTLSWEPNRSWLLDYIPESDQAAVIAAIDEAIRLKKTFELEHRVVRADAGLIVASSLRRINPSSGRRAVVYVLPEYAPAKEVDA